MINKNYPLIGLDFDGVLFNSAYEAYWIAENTALKFENFKSFTFEEFLLFRKKIKSARDLATYYSKDFNQVIDKKKLQDIYEQKFYATRFNIMNSYGDNYCTKFFPALDFFKAISSVLTNKPYLFCIISTRDTNSINLALESHNIFMKNNIIGSELFYEYNRKSSAFTYKYGNQAKLEIYVDDFDSHCIDMLSVSKKSVQADWGYGEVKDNAFSFKEITKMVMEICD